MGNYFRRSLGKALFYSDLICFTCTISKTYRDVSDVLDDIFCNCDNGRKKKCK